jgi:hypothetical protein
MRTTTYLTEGGGENRETIKRSEQEIRDKIEEFSYIFDISDELRMKYERNRLDLYSPFLPERTKLGHPLQYDDYIRYGIIIALEWVLGLRESLGEEKKNTTGEDINKK